MCQLPKVSYLTRTLVKELRIYLLIRLLSEFIPFKNPQNTAISIYIPRVLFSCTKITISNHLASSTKCKILLDSDAFLHTKKTKERKQEKQNSIHKGFSNNCLWLELFPKLAPWGGKEQHTCRHDMIETINLFLFHFWSSRIVERTSACLAEIKNSELCYS